MNLLQDNNQRILLVDIDGKSWSGMAYYCDADTNETEEDALTVKVGSDYIEFLESDIQSVNQLTRHLILLGAFLMLKERRSYVRKSKTIGSTRIFATFRS